MRFPIAITTYNRPEYFCRTIDSLRQCGEDLSWLGVYDDASTDENQRIALSNCDVNYNIADKNLGPYLAGIRAITNSWENYNSDYLIYAQDDVEFSRGCFQEAYRIAQLIQKDGHNLAILSLFHRAKKLHDGEYWIMQVGHPGAICWMITRKFWDDFLKNGVDKPCEFAPNDERKKHFVRDLLDYKICRWAQCHGYTIAIPRYSLVQHIGNVSSLGGRDMSFCASPYYIGDVDGKEK